MRRASWGQWLPFLSMLSRVEFKQCCYVYVFDDFPETDTCLPFYPNLTLTTCASIAWAHLIGWSWSFGSFH